LDGVLDAFLEYALGEGLELYGHQEEAILEVFAGKNVILNTPTGSGKSLVALAMQYRALCLGRRSFYTVPVKALANEKFLSLCRVFGSEEVGMMTGDATVNREASIICCTAEILANLALRDGSFAAVDDVIMDEFHYYSDHSRGSAWQVPLLTLPQSRFLLMSATLGDTELFEKGLTELTGVDTALVKSEERPVPLEFEYRETPLEETILELVEKNRAPVYLVHFTQRACAVSSQNLLSSNFCSKEEKREISVALQDANFRSPYGKEVNKLLRHGIGIHHAGLLPKYRVLVEKLTQRGLLKVICGTDTLGVGVNVPIRTVLFTQLCKFDGKGTRILTVRDFKQICGRAGRRGFDTVGYVAAQAPEHVIANLKLAAKASGQQGKKGKFVKKKAPERGFIAWDEETFVKLQSSPPEKLSSSFKMQHSLLLNVLGRNGEDGCAALKQLIEDSHETPAGKSRLKREAFGMFRNLVRADVLEIIPVAERTGPVKVGLHVDLQEDFSLNHALGIYLLDTIPLLDAEAADYALNLISLIEAILENPMAVLLKQVDALKTELMAEMKRDGVEYEERIERLEEVEWPKPGSDFIYSTFNAFIDHHQWVGEDSIKPKCIAREILESYSSFDDYVRTYKLERSEGVLLRHLSEVFKVLAQTVPLGARTEEVEEAELFFLEMLKGVDTSLIEEWERLRHPETVADAVEIEVPRALPLTRNKEAFLRLVRHDVFAVLKRMAARDCAEFEVELAEYLEGHSAIRLDPEARNKRWTIVEEKDGEWLVEQVLVDPDQLNDWAVMFTVDLAASDQAGEVVMRVSGVDFRE
jgi:superfamily II RNA helicase